MNNKWWQKVDTGRRKLLQGLLVGGGAVLAGRAAAAPEPKDTKSPNPKAAESTPATDAADESAAKGEARFPGDPPENFVVYQLNKSEREYQEHVIFSVGAMLRQYNDNIKIVVTAFGPGIHLLLKKPRRPVAPVLREKVSSLNEYGVEFHGCGNTLKALKLTEKDLLPFVKYVEVGASDLLELQKKGYAYISW